MNIMNLALGVAVLFFGRRLFWIFVGIAGFLFGMEFGPKVVTGASQEVVLVAAIVTGLIGVVIAVFAQKLAFAMAGFS